MVGAEGLKMFEVNTSKLLENIVKALPSHFKFEQTSVLFFGVPEFGYWHRICSIEILLDTS